MLQNFLEAVGGRGMGALELVAMDMKARGMYVCRTLSFAGLTPLHTPPRAPAQHASPPLALSILCALTDLRLSCYCHCFNCGVQFGSEHVCGPNLVFC